MPESHSETTSKYVAVRGDVGIQPARFGDTRVIVTDAKASNYSLDMHGVDVAPWLSRSEQETILRALEFGRGGVPSHPLIKEAIALLRERLATT